jgi:hypothetical protein
MRQSLSGSQHAAHSAGQSKWNTTITAMSRLLLLVLISAGLGSPLPALGASSESRPRSALTGVPGLEKFVTYSETKIPLGELVARVAADTGVPLTAARDVADEPVAVTVNEFSARELLEELADLLDYHWSRRQGGSGREDGTQPLTPNAQGPSPSYEIWQDLASKQREEALRQGQRADVEQRFQEEMALYWELAGKSQEEMRQLWDEADRWKERLENLPPAERRALLNSSAGWQEDRRHNLVRYFWSPVLRAIAGLSSRLSPEQWAALRAGQQVIFSSDPSGGKLSLPPDVLHVFRTARPFLPAPASPRSAPPDDDEGLRQWKRRVEAQWDQAEGYDVTFRLFAFEGRWAKPGSIEFEMLAAPARGGKRLGERFSQYLVIDEKADPPTEEDSERRARLGQDPVLSVKKSFQPDTRPYVDPLFPSVSRTIRLLPELLPELARTYDVNFIADSYWSGVRGGSFSGPLSAGMRPLFEVLDGLTGVYYNWDRRGSLVRIRHRRWFLVRPREIPLRTVRRWTSLFDRLGALPLKEFVLSATTLTDLQLEGLLVFSQRGVFPPHMNDLQALNESRSMLRLYARLSPAERQALQAGKSLMMAQLSPALRPFVLAQLDRNHRWSYPPPDLAQWGGGSLTLSRTPDVRIRERRGRSVTWRLGSEPAPGVATPPDAVTRFPVTRLQMEIHTGAQTPAAASVIVAAGPVPPE